MQTIRIGLVWHAVAATNLGVGALTASNMALARQAAARAGLKPHFVVIGPRETGPVSLSGPDIETRTITGRYMISPGGFRRDVATLDLLLDISAGDSFADIYPDKRFAYMAATKVLPLLRGKPLVLSPQTIGPFTRQPHRAVAAWICRRAAAVFARDPLSMQLLHEMAPDARARQVIDVAFALPFARPERLNGGPVKVGLNVSGLLMSGGYGGKDDYGLGFDYAALTRQLIAALLDMAGVEVHLVPHVMAPGIPRDDDGAAADRLQAEFPALHRHPDFASASDAKSFIAGMDFFVGARMHATIAAYSAGVPVVPISYSRKFEGLYGGLSYPWLVNAKGMTTEAALRFILDAFQRRDDLGADIERGRGIVSAGLEDYVAELARLFGEAAPA